MLGGVGQDLRLFPEIPAGQGPPAVVHLGIRQGARQPSGRSPDRAGPTGEAAREDRAILGTGSATWLGKLGQREWDREGGRGQDGDQIAFTSCITLSISGGAKRRR